MPALPPFDSYTCWERRRPAGIFVSRAQQEPRPYNNLVSRCNTVFEELLHPEILTLQP